jgi:hypothetical protein
LSSSAAGGGPVFAVALAFAVALFGCHPRRGSAVAFFACHTKLSSFAAVVALPLHFLVVTPEGDLRLPLHLFLPSSDEPQPTGCPILRVFCEGWENGHSTSHNAVAFAVACSSRHSERSEEPLYFYPGRSKFAKGHKQNSRI